jgi:hypothetical protein
MNNNYGRLTQQFLVKFARSYLREYVKGCSNTIDVLKLNNNNIVAHKN